MASMTFSTLWDKSEGLSFVQKFLVRCAGEHPIAQLLIIGYGFGTLCEGLFSIVALYSMTLPILLSLGKYTQVSKCNII